MHRDLSIDSMSFQMAYSAEDIFLKTTLFNGLSSSHAGAMKYIINAILILVPINSHVYQRQ